MSNLLLHDGFDNYTIANTGTGLAANCFLNISNVWTYSGSATAQSLAPGVYGGLSVQLTINNIMYRALSTTAGSVTVGFRLYAGSTILAQNNSSMRLLSGGSGGTTQIMMNILTSGAIQITRGSTIGTNVLGTSSAAIIGANSNHYIEVSVSRNATTGTLTVYVDGSAVITATGLNTGSADFDTIGLQGGGASNVVIGYDDLYVIDSLTPLGEVRIESLYPDSNDSVTWSPLNTEYRLYGTTSANWCNTGYSGITITSFIPTIGNWLFAFVNRESASPPGVPSDWTLISSALDSGGLNSTFIYQAKITESLINSLTTASSNSSSIGPFYLNNTASFNGCQFIVEVPYDGVDPFLASVASATCQYSTTSGGGGISIPSVSSATEDLLIITLVGSRGSAVANPTLTGGYDSQNGANWSSGSGLRFFALGLKSIASGGSFTPGVTWSGASTAYSMANLILPRKYVVNYMAVNDRRPDGDISYNYTTSTSATDQFTLTDPSSDPVTIHFVIPKTIARKDDAASRTITPNIVSGGTPGGSPVTTALTGSYALQQGKVYDLDPNTGSSWTYSAITSLKLKYTAGT